jgi:hypothetical protein
VPIKSSPVPIEAEDAFLQTASKPTRTVSGTLYALAFMGNASSTAQSKAADPQAFPEILFIGMYSSFRYYGHYHK